MGNMFDVVEISLLPYWLSPPCETTSEDICALLAAV